MTVPDKLPDDIAELKAIIRAQQDQNARLETLVASFKKALFGAKSEKIDPAQYELELEDIETAIAQVEAVVLSRLRSGLSTHLCGLSFKSQGAFAAER